MDLLRRRYSCCRDKKRHRLRRTQFQTSTRPSKRFRLHRLGLEDQKDRLVPIHLYVLIRRRIQKVHDLLEFLVGQFHL